MQRNKQCEYSIAVLHINSAGQITRKHLFALPVLPNMVYHLHARRIRGEQCERVHAGERSYNQVSFLLNNALRLQLGPGGWPDDCAFSRFGLNAYAPLWHNHALSRRKIDVFEATATNAVECYRLKNGHPRQGGHCIRQMSSRHTSNDITSHVTRHTIHIKSHTSNDTRQTSHVTRDKKNA